ncbi:MULTISPECIES: helix-turn-helix transcriptional regulator [Burkholderia]|uniref:helix-turn-helix transcriptional regulator n=1 Tax=Burkholderia TaxID=32008 RepID=UPI0005726213|nr:MULTISPECIES: AlpA family phage regulatory protein [Burkholderia]APY91875.1 AlpA family transcriptional regulator [Burkholderia pseudomallei]MBO2988268.1 AlpA family phage regulatory protein [Burkholderia pseudomallei]MBO7920516.1 AlpA family phage regulatory protein [Burkholderia pseudomallei]OMO11407.1 AlpA family transcriptional regulator [Burkholderia pseudomallei]OMW55073.1 AlpA family transcriptional regulator [Burkholderia pseudomallei]
MANRILRLVGVLEATGVSKGAIYKWVREGKFPEPVRLSARTVGWRQVDVDAWLEAREQVQLCRVGG